VGAFVASFLLYALRCEGCKTREFKFLDWITWKALFAPARFCPKCGIARV
jgi:rRNA maturation endonuclease Nob1